MKNGILIIGLVLVFLNTLIGFVFNKYSQFNIGFVDVSIIISTSLIYLVSRSELVDGFKIGLTTFYSFTGFIRIICAAVAASTFSNNTTVIIFISVIAIEIISTVVAAFMNKA